MNEKAWCPVVNEKLKEKIQESLSSVLPITMIVLVLVPMEIGTLALFLTGAVLLIVGMGFFQLGAEMSMTALRTERRSTVDKEQKYYP